MLAYHVNTGVDTASAILGNVRNHLNADPATKIVVVTHGPGIDFLLQDARDSRGREFSSAVSDLASKGVAFRVCNNTLVTRNINPDKLRSLVIAAGAKRMTVTAPTFTVPKAWTSAASSSRRSPT